MSNHGTDATVSKVRRAPTRKTSGTVSARYAPTDPNPALLRDISTSRDGTGQITLHENEV